jgi:hypothetical protein
VWIIQNQCHSVLSHVLVPNQRKLDVGRVRGTQRHTNLRYEYKDNKESGMLYKRVMTDGQKERPWSTAMTYLWLFVFASALSHFQPHHYNAIGNTVCSFRITNEKKATSKMASCSCWSFVVGVFCRRMRKSDLFVVGVLFGWAAVRRLCWCALRRRRVSEGHFRHLLSPGMVKRYQTVKL